MAGQPRVRAWRPGDRVHLADTPGHRTVVRALREAGVPRIERPWTLVVEDAAGIVAVVGLGVAERVSVDAGTIEAQVLVCE